MTRSTLHRWLFTNHDGQKITFTQKGMPFRILRPDAVFGGTVDIGGTKCRIRIIRKESAEKGKKNEVRFPDFEWRQNEYGNWTSKVTDEESTLVGYMEIKGNWKEGTGKCIFHAVGLEEGELDCQLSEEEKRQRIEWLRNFKEIKV